MSLFDKFYSMGTALSLPTPPRGFPLSLRRPDLCVCPASPVPQVLRSCAEFVEEYGVVDGIYRLSGVSSNIQKLR